MCRLGFQTIIRFNFSALSFAALALALCPVAQSAPETNSPVTMEFNNFVMPDTMGREITKPWLPFNAKSRPIGPGIFWIRLKLPTVPAIDPAIYFERMFGNFSLYCGDTLIYENGDSLQVSLKGSAHYNVHLIKLDRVFAANSSCAEDRTLLMRVSSIEKRVGPADGAIFGNQKDIFEYVWRHEADSCAVGVIALTLGLSAGLFAAVQRKRKEYFWFAIFALGIGFNNLLIRPSVNLTFFQDSFVSKFISQLQIQTLPLMMVGLTGFLCRTYTRGPKNILLHVRNFFLGTTLLMCTFSIFGMMSAHAAMIALRTLPLLGVALIISIASMVIHFVKEPLQRKAMAPLFVGLWFFAVAAGHDLLRLSHVISSPVNLLIYGVLGFLLCLLFILAKRVAAVYRDNLKQATDKARMAAELAGARKVRNILDHINEGIFTFDNSRCIDDEHSIFLRTIFDLDAAALNGMDVTKLLIDRADMSPDSKDLVNAAILSIIGESEISWHANVSHLPKAIVINSTAAVSNRKFLAVDWIPLFSLDGSVVERIMVTIRDVTEERQLKYEVEQHRLKSERLTTTIAQITAKSRGVVIAFLADSILKLKNIATGIAAPKIDIQSIYREAHTIKGQARMLDFKPISEASHLLEACFDKVRQNEPVTMEEMAIQLAKVDSEVQYYNSVVTDILELKRGSESSHAWTLFDFATGSLATLRKQITDVKLPLPLIMVTDGVGSWAGLSSDVSAILTHAVSNAIDHGFVRPVLRGGKPLRPEISVVATMESDNKIHLLISDNGVGIDTTKIKELARAASTRSDLAPEAKKALGERPEDVLFLDGVSTAEAVSESSGRGVGLAAVRAFARRMGGDAKIGANPTGGTRLEVTFAATHLKKAA